MKQAPLFAHLPRPLLLCGLLSLALAPRGAAQQREFDGGQAMERVEQLLSLGPRIPGTEGHRQAGDWIERSLRALADTVVVQRWDHVNRHGDTVALRNLVARFRPGAPRRVLYAGHWDTQPLATGANSKDPTRPTPGANNNASGVAILLGVAQALHGRPTQRLGVDLLFTDAEDYGDWQALEDVLLGSTYYAAHPVSEHQPEFAVVFDLVGDADLQIYQEEHSLRQAGEAVKLVWRVARDLGYRRYIIGESLYEVTDDHVPLQEAGYRALLMTDLDYPHWDSTEDTLDKLSARSLEIVGNTAIAVLRRVDR